MRLVLCDGPQDEEYAEVGYPPPFWYYVLEHLPVQDFMLVEGNIPELSINKHTHVYELRSRSVKGITYFWYRYMGTREEHM